MKFLKSMYSMCFLSTLLCISGYSDYNNPAQRQNQSPKAAVKAQVKQEKSERKADLNKNDSKNAVALKKAQDKRASELRETRAKRQAILDEKQSKRDGKVAELTEKMNKERSNDLNNEKLLRMKEDKSENDMQKREGLDLTERNESNGIQEFKEDLNDNDRIRDAADRDPNRSGWSN